MRQLTLLPLLQRIPVPLPCHNLRIAVGPTAAPTPDQLAIAGTAKASTYLLCVLWCVTMLPHCCPTACLTAAADQARDFIKQALRKDPYQRPTVHMLLRHPWLRAYQVRAWEASERQLSACSWDGRSLLARQLAQLRNWLG